MNSLELGILFIVFALLLISAIITLIARHEITQTDKQAIAVRTLGVWTSAVEILILILVGVHILGGKSILVDWIPYVVVILSIIAGVMSTVAAIKYKNSTEYDTDPKPYNGFISGATINFISAFVMLCYFGYTLFKIETFQAKTNTY